MHSNGAWKSRDVGESTGVTGRKAPRRQAAQPVLAKVRLHKKKKRERKKKRKGEKERKKKRHKKGNANSGNLNWYHQQAI